ncbi:MAG: hypothetical protein P8X96_06035 [Desulfobacteraceae bacterium]
MKTYKLSWHYRLIVVPIIVLVATIASIGTLPDVIDILFSTGILDKVALIEYFGVLIATAILWYAVLVIPYKIAIRADGRLGFRSLSKQKIILATQIFKIENDFFTSKIHYGDGKIYLTNLMNEFSSIAESIKQLNPKIEIKNNT